MQFEMVNFSNLKSTLTLPEELMIKVFKFLSFSELEKVGLVCKRWQKLINDKSLGLRLSRQLLKEIPKHLHLHTIKHQHLSHFEIHKTFCATGACEFKWIRNQLKITCLSKNMNTIRDPDLRLIPIARCKQYFPVFVPRRLVHRANGCLTLCKLYNLNLKYSISLNPYA